MTPEIRNYEFEAKVFQDLACTLNGGGCFYIASMGASDEFMAVYGDWIIDVGVEGAFTVDDIESFNNSCEEWDNYPSEYDPNYEPELLLLLLNLLNN